MAAPDRLIPGTTTAFVKKQRAAVIQAFYKMVFEHPAIKAVTKSSVRQTLCTAGNHFKGNSKCHTYLLAAYIRSLDDEALWPIYFNKGFDQFNAYRSQAVLRSICQAVTDT